MSSQKDWEDFLAEEVSEARRRLEEAVRPEHDCEDNVIETATQPDRSGAIIVTKTCEICGRHLGSHPDSIL